MTERALAVLLLYALLFAYDIPRLKRKENKVIYVYSAMIFASFYFSISFILDTNWLTITDLINFVFLEPAERIENFLAGE